MLPPGPPLDPSGEEGRRLLRNELVKSEYHDQNLFQRLLAWLDRVFHGSVGVASGTSWLRVLITMLVAALLVVGLVVVLSRIRRERRRRTPAEPVLPADRPSAAVLRRQAEAALAEGRTRDAVLDAFRALAARQVERGALADQPGATAHEVAIRLAATYPEQGAPVGRSADLFDATLYGDRPATRDDAAGVLGLDDRLAGVR
jgi:hypothetical protein